MSHLRIFITISLCSLMLLSVGKALTFKSKDHHPGASIASIAVCKPFVVDESPNHAPYEPAKVFCVPAITSEPEELHNETQVVTESLIS